MLKIRKAEKCDVTAVCRFFDKLLDDIGPYENLPRWKKGCYPSDGYLTDMINEGSLYMGLYDGEIAAAMVVNKICTDGYDEVKWGINASSGEAYFIHTLGVSPTFARRGFAIQMLEEAIDIARRGNGKAVRLDVIDGNEPANQLYTKAGFDCRGVYRLYYEDTGWENFTMYEYVL